MYQVPLIKNSYETLIFFFQLIIQKKRQLKDFYIFTNSSKMHLFSENKFYNDLYFTEWKRPMYRFINDVNPS